jgi:dynactin 1
MRVTIEDLEALKELNDELEENHVETERQLNAELGELCSLQQSYIQADNTDKLGAQLREERDRAEELDSVVLDMDNTIGQFRDLVQALQRSARLIACMA